MSVKIIPKRGPQNSIPLTTMSDGEIVISNDTNHLFVKRGSNLKLVNNCDFDSLSNRPSSQFSGRFFYATDTKELYLDDGNNWILIWSDFDSKYEYRCVDYMYQYAITHKGDYATRRRTTMYFTLSTPPDLHSVINTKFVFISYRTQTGDIDLYSDYAYVNKIYNINSESHTISNFSHHQNKIEEINIDSVLTNLNANMNIGIHINTDQYIYPLYIRLEYLADLNFMELEYV